MPARVIVRFGADVVVKTEAGESLRCTAKRKFEHIACGDYVDYRQDATGNGQITHLYDRKNALVRPDYAGRPKSIAANIDQLIIIGAWYPSPAFEVIDRYLIAAHGLSAEAVLVFNKSDCADSSTDEIRYAVSEYKHLGLPVLNTIALESQEQGIADLKKWLVDKTSILVGQSGVGKSSIAQWLLPELSIQVGDVDDHGEGKHTTTASRLYELDEGGCLIDSPGVRDFVLYEVSQTQLQSGYREFAEFSPYCKFSNCTHRHEPQCAVLDAVEQGKLPKKRYERYARMVEQLQK